MAKTLTAAGIKSLRPTSQRQEIKDGASVGLYLILQPSGHRSFALRFRRPDGRPAKMALGPFDPTTESDGDPVIGAPLTLAGARRLAADLNRERARGKDIVADRKAEKSRMRLQHQERAANTFSQCARDFIEGHAKKRRTGNDTARVLGYLPDGSVIPRSLADLWAHKPIASIDGHVVYNTVEEARQRGIPGWAVKTDGPSEARARHVHAALSSMFGWLHRHRRVESNPCIGVHRPDGPQSRDRVLTDAEIQKFWQACSSVGEPFGSIFRLLLLTGCRLNEVAGMGRSELSNGTWTIPGARTKNGRTHVVPLSPEMQGILDAAIRVSDCPFVFTWTGKTAVSGWSKSKKRLDAAMGDIAPWRLHDLRRTCATGMAEIGIAPHIVEACLNHISGARAGVAGVYNRAAYAAEKKSALERWADHVEGARRRPERSRGAAAEAAVTKRRQWPRGKNGDLPDWYGPDAAVRRANHGRVDA